MQEPHAPEGQDRPHRSPDKGERHTLREEGPRQIGATGTHGRADRHFLLARLGTHQQEVSHVAGTAYPDPLHNGLH